MNKRTGLDGRHRDLDGEIERKKGNTTVGSLRDIYGDGFASGHRGDKKLENLLADERVNSLSQLFKKHTKWR